tara:strand:+ start:33 stop:263 length:231 start_codon:yes stop_codon:yes gene_type:complete
LKISKIKLNLKKTKKTLLLEFLQQSITEENKSSPLTDEKLKLLFEKKHKVFISRKTISKYRAKLKIPSSHDRKTEL